MLKIYGSNLCPDCVNCCRELREANVEFEYCDFADNLLHLKEFLKLRDTGREFDEIRAAGKIGIPCILRGDGSFTLDWKEFLK
ncbi:MAG: glutaredoxin [Oscillospiraceae bacterium]|nr:glutaredoxin [Oscillospiraceae bacterium]